MRFSAMWAVPLMALTLALPSVAAAQTKPHGPLFVRFSGGFIVGQDIEALSDFPVVGFTFLAGVAFPIAHREDMEIQVELVYRDYSGVFNHPGGRQTLSATALGPGAIYLYNFVRGGRSVRPFVGGGVNLAYEEQTLLQEAFNPFFQGTLTQQSASWVTSLVAVGGVQFASRSRVKFRVEGRLNLSNSTLVAFLGGISF